MKVVILWGVSIIVFMILVEAGAKNIDVVHGDEVLLKCR